MNDNPNGVPPLPKRHSAPITRRHADGTACTHRIAPNGKPQEGEGCPSPAGYTAKCKVEGCDFESSAGIRAIVEEKKRLHLFATRTAAQ